MYQLTYGASMTNQLLPTQRVLNLPQGGSVLVHGILDIQTIDIHGIQALRPLRLPQHCAAFFAQYEFETMRAITAQCSGVKLTFTTTAASIALQARFTRVDFGELESVANHLAVSINNRIVSEIAPSIDVVESISRDGATCHRTFNRDYSITHLDLNNPEHNEQQITLWLPQSLIVDLVGITGDEDESVIADSSASSQSKKLRWIHYGSSISHCHTPLSPLDVWPTRVANQQDLELTNMGFAGQCMLDPYVAQSIARYEADIITMSIGVNITGARAMNQRTFIPALHGFLDTIRQTHPDTPIVLVSSIYWPESDNIPGPADVHFHDDGSVTCYCYGNVKDIPVGALTLEQSRYDIEYAVHQRQHVLGDHNLYYLNGLQLFGPSDVSQYPLPDGLHPDAVLYREIARRFSQAVFRNSSIVAQQ